jgi:ribose 5-phosphate isomerase A
MDAAGFAEFLAPRVATAQYVGVGTGRTVEAVLRSLSGSLSLSHQLFVASSYETARLLTSLGYSALHPAADTPQLDLYFDGADEVDPSNRLIKGRGGALLKEKILASRSKEFIVVVDESKIVERLGSKFPVPVEVVVDAVDYVGEKLRAVGATKVEVRSGASGKNGPCFTENGCLLLDAYFSSISHTLELDIKSITGVLESGIFLTQASEIVILSGREISVRRKSQ